MQKEWEVNHVITTKALVMKLMIVPVVTATAFCVICGMRHTDQGFFEKRNENNFK